MSTLEEYLNKHKIIGTTQAGCFCVDTIVSCPVEFVRTITASNCYIAEIIMWVRTNRQVGSQLGYGGPPDPRAPDDYFFSETLYAKQFSITATEDDYVRFISEARAKQPNAELYPGFTVRYK